MGIIDLRSDTVTRPTAAMYEAMQNAELGDEIYGGDPTVTALEEYAADIFGFDAALFVPSGTQANLIALLVHCPRGSEYIAGEGYHIHRLEGGGGAALAGVSAWSIMTGNDGIIPIDALAAAIKPNDIHYPNTRLVCLENTYNGHVQSLEYVESVSKFCNDNNLVLHLDGARIFNASVARGLPVTKLTAPAHSLSACLSKGLCAPAGAMLCGTGDFIQQARYWRKSLGGCMRQTGILAACGLVALETMCERLVEDHDKAKLLAEKLADIPELGVDLESVETNMVFAKLRDGINNKSLREHLKCKGIYVSGSNNRLRMVTHHDISDSDITATINAFRSFFTSAS